MGQNSRDPIIKLSWAERLFFAVLTPVAWLRIKWGEHK